MSFGKVLLYFIFCLIYLCVISYTLAFCGYFSQIIIFTFSIIIFYYIVLYITKVNFIVNFYLSYIRRLKRVSCSDFSFNYLLLDVDKIIDINVHQYTDLLSNQDLFIVIFKQNNILHYSLLNRDEYMFCKSKIDQYILNTDYTNISKNIIEYKLYINILLFVLFTAFVYFSFSIYFTSYINSRLKEYHCINDNDFYFLSKEIKNCGVRVEDFNFYSVDKLKEKVSGLIKNESLFSSYFKSLDNYYQSFYGNATNNKGVIMHGTIGNGKTTLASVLASENNVPLVSVAAARFGRNIHNIMSLCSHTSKKYGGVVLVIEEIDCIGSRGNPNRWTQALTDDVFNRDCPLECLCQLIDQQLTKDVFIVANTNFISRIDPMLRRDGRLGFLMSVNAPDSLEVCNLIKNVTTSFARDNQSPLLLNQLSLFHEFVNKTSHYISDNKIPRSTIYEACIALSSLLNNSNDNFEDLYIKLSICYCNRIFGFETPSNFVNIINNEKYYPYINKLFDLKNYKLCSQNVDLKKYITLDIIDLTKNRININKTRIVKFMNESRRDIIIEY